MDFFSIIPMILFFYAISTIFSSQGKKPNNRRPHPPRRHPNDEKPKPPTSRPEMFSPRSWKEKFEELEQELFPKREDQIPSNTSKPMPTIKSYRMRKYYKERALEDINRSIEKSEINNKSSEESISIESYLKQQEALAATVKGSKSYSQQAPLPGITGSTLKQGVIWAEVLGKPRALRKWSYDRR